MTQPKMYTTVTKQPYSTSLCLIEHIARLVRKPAGSAKHKDRLTLLIITNMDGSDHRKLSVIGKAKTFSLLAEVV